MAMPPYAYMEAKRDADLHIQLRIESRASLTDDLGEVLVKGTVVRVFRGKGVKVGDEIGFDLKVYRPPEEPMPDAGGWVTEEALEGMEYLEIFLDGLENSFRVSAEGSLHFRIEGPSKKPTEPTPGWWEVRRARREFR